jgi:hypothetical protein
MTVSALQGHIILSYAEGGGSITYYNLVNLHSCENIKSHQFFLIYSPSYIVKILRSRWTKPEQTDNFLTFRGTVDAGERKPSY